MSIFPKTQVVAPSGGDTDSIATAISNLSGNGGRIIVEEGTYSIGTAISIPDNVSIIGNGNACIEISDNNVVLFAVGGKGGESTEKPKEFQFPCGSPGLFQGIPVEIFHKILPSVTLFFVLF